MLGADHAGYVGRYKALVAAMGDDPEQHLEILLGQLVNLVRDGEPVRMSKRAGTVVLLADLVEAVGADAARYALARSSVDQQIDLDLDLWSRQTNDNPVFYVQYAHARISSLLRNAADLGLSPRRRRRRRREPRSGTSGRTTCCARSASSPGSSPPPPSCGRRTASPGTWRSWPAPTTGSTTRAACSRAATRSPARRPPPGCGRARPRRRCCATARRPRRARPAVDGGLHGADGEGAPGRSAAWQHRPADGSGRPAGRPRRARPARLAAVGGADRRRAAPGRPSGHRAGPHARHAAVRPRRGRLPRPGRGLRHRLRRRRRALRLQGLPLRTGRPVDGRGRPAPGRVQRQRAQPGAGRGLPARADRAARQQQVGRRTAAGRRRGHRAHRRRLVRRDRPAGAAGRGPGGGRRRPGAGAHPRDGRASRRTPTSSSPPPTRTRSSASRWPPATR